MTLLDIVLLSGVLFGSWVLAILVRCEIKDRRQKKENEKIFRHFIDQYNKMEMEEAKAQNKGKVIYYPFQQHDSKISDGDSKECIIEDIEHYRMVYDPITGNWQKFWIRDTTK